jgi:hypothetical protein
MRPATAQFRDPLVTDMAGGSRLALLMMWNSDAEWLRYAHTVRDLRRDVTNGQPRTAARRHVLRLIWHGVVCSKPTSCYVRHTSVADCNSQAAGHCRCHSCPNHTLARRSATPATPTRRDAESLLAFTRSELVNMAQRLEAAGQLGGCDGSCCTDVGLEKT